MRKTVKIQFIIRINTHKKAGRFLLGVFRLMVQLQLFNKANPAKWVFHITELNAHEGFVQAC